MYLPNSIRPPTLEESEGYPVLRLPKHGTELKEGRQYELTPSARAVVYEQHGIVLPRVVECLHKQRPAMRYATHALNLETGEAKWSVMEQERQEPTFRAWLSLGKIHRFTLDLEDLSERALQASGSHKAKELEEMDERDLPKWQREKLTKSREPKKERTSKVSSAPTIDVLSLLNLDMLK